MLDRTAKPLVGVTVSRREGRRSHAVKMGEQASKPGLHDGNAGGGQGQMPMGALLKCNFPQPHPPTYFWRTSSGDV